MGEIPDEKLIEAYLAGDEESLEVLFARYVPRAAGFVRKYVARPEDVEDIVQHIFINAWKKLGRFDSGKSFKVWLFAIAKNAAFDFLRKKKTVPFSDFNDGGGDENAPLDTGDMAPLPVEIAESREFAGRLDAALSELPALGRAVVVLHLQEDLSLQEIADILGEPLNTVKSRYRRALCRLRKYFEKQNG
jgi:RNA polymerase sigma-70 factor, ECF subfamily